MNRARLWTHATAIVALCAALCAPGCSSTEPAPKDPRIKPVSGRTQTGAGLSVDFPKGWAEVPLRGPFTHSYESQESQIALHISEFPGQGQSLSTLGDQLQRHLAKEGNILESGEITVDGLPGYRVLGEPKMEGGNGLAGSVAVLREGGRVTSVLIRTLGKARPENRAEVEALIASLKTEP